MQALTVHVSGAGYMRLDLYDVRLPGANGRMGCITNAASTTDWPHLPVVASLSECQSVAKAAFVIHFQLPHPHICPGLPYIMAHDS